MMGRCNHFATTWKEFKRALMRSRDPFNPFYWIYRLIYAIILDIGVITGLYRIPWRKLVPIFAILLIISIITAYYFKLRNELIYPRWCTSSNTATASDDSNTCMWIKLHDVLVSYFGIMIIFHFIHASMLSPGYVITDHDNNNDQNSNGSSLIDRESERKRLALYGNLKLLKDENNTKTIDNTTNERQTRRDDNNDEEIFIHPSPYASYCNKCKIIRPPRCHHCKVCNRCVLQYDHHCLWLNQCIGYNNCRSFLLTVIYITIGCWYGVILLYKPFYEPLQNKLRIHGGLYAYIEMYMEGKLNIDEEHLFAIPTIADIVKMIRLQQTLPVQAVIDIVFPLLMGVGAILSIFLGTHVKYILRAVTTLEYRIVIDRQYDDLLKRLESSSSIQHSNKGMKWVNPFDQGYSKNWTQIMGSSVTQLLLPVVPTAPLPPYIPTLKKE